MGLRGDGGGCRILCSVTWMSAWLFAVIGSGKWDGWFDGL